jgi:DNA-binding CsgD family transcriptional regulator
MLSAVMPLPVPKTYEAFHFDEACEESRTPTPSILDILTAALEEIDYGLLVLDPLSYRLHHANRLALLECRSGGTLTLDQGRIHARDAACRQPLEKALGLVASDRRSLVSLESERGACTVAVVPLADAFGTRQALLMYGKNAVCEQLSASFYARLHALTPSEDSVLKALCRGLRPAEIAKETGVAISTVRTQVSSIRMKTRTSSIHDLVRTMSTLPPINPVLRMVRAAN